MDQLIFFFGECANYIDVKENYFRKYKIKQTTKTGIFHKHHQTMINFFKKFLIGNIEWCLYLNIFIIKRKTITESLVLIFINSLKTFDNKNEGIMCIFLSNAKHLSFFIFYKVFDFGSFIRMWWRLGNVWWTWLHDEYDTGFSTRSDGTSYTYMVDLTESKIRAKCI